MNTKLLIVDDHELIINGIKNMLYEYKIINCGRS